MTHFNLPHIIKHNLFRRTIFSYFQIGSPKPVFGVGFGIDILFSMPVLKLAELGNITCITKYFKVKVKRKRSFESETFVICLRKSLYF